MNKAVLILTGLFTRQFLPCCLALVAPTLSSVSIAQSVGFSLPTALSKLDQSPTLRQALTVYRQAQADFTVARAKAGVQIRVETKGNDDFVFSSGINSFNANLQLGLSVPLVDDHKQE